MKTTLMLLTLLLIAATPETTLELPTSLRVYTNWQQITPAKYSVEGWLARLCVSPAHPGQMMMDETELPASVPVRVFANPVALTSLRTKDPFPEGSILVKEKTQRSEEGVFVHHGVMIKEKNNWEFSYYPSTKGDSFEACVACHRTSAHDFVFTPYLKQ